MRDELLVYAPAASAAYAARVAQHAGVALAPLEERDFEDGEHKARPLASVRGRDVALVHSLYGDAGQSANDKLVRMLLLIGTLRDAGAARIMAVCPYLAYARKDRRTKARDPVSTRYVAELFEAVGTDVMVTIDVHNLAAFENAFRCRTTHLEAAGLFVRHLVPLLGEAEVVVVSPDAGGIKRAEALRQRLARELGRCVGAGFAEKYRSAGVVTGDAFVGDVDGRTALIVDDLISGGTTIARAAAACKARGAARIIATATHGVFAAAANATLGDAPVDRILVTDTVAPRCAVEAPLGRKLTVLDTAPLLGAALRCLHDDGSIVALLEA